MSSLVPSSAEHNQLHSRVARRADEVQARMNTEVDLVLATGLLLLKHVGLVLVIEKFDNGHPRIPVVDVVAETRSVDNGQADYGFAVSKKGGKDELRMFLDGNK